MPPAVNSRMAVNPYAPPRSDVAEARSPTPLAARPRPVTRAVHLLYLTIPLSALTIPYDYEGAPGQAVLRLVYTVFLVWLYWRIGRGRNWARITFLVLMLLSVPAMVEHAADLREDPLPHLLLDAVVLALEFTAAFWLLTPAAASWFRPAP